MGDLHLLQQTLSEDLLKQLKSEHSGLPPFFHEKRKKKATISPKL